MSELDLGRMGLVLNVADDRAHIEQAAEAERLGFSALWLFGGQLELLEPLAELLRATKRAAVAPAIVSLDVHGVDDVVSRPGSPQAGACAGTRGILGPDATLVVIQPVVLDADLDRARQTVRGPLGFLLSVGGYAANMRRMGFGDDDIAGMSDELVDAIATVGDVDAILAGVRAHLDAGADHVALSVFSDGGQPGAIEVARAVAGADLSLVRAR